MKKRVQMILLCFCTVILSTEVWSGIRPEKIQRNIENTKALEKEKLELFAKQTVKEEILGFLCQDYDNDGRLEAFFLTDKQKEEEISILCDVWFTDGKYREKLIEDVWIYLESMEVWELKECKIHFQNKWITHFLACLMREEMTFLSIGKLMIYIRMELGIHGSGITSIGMGQL